MNIALRDQFTHRWNQYFPGAELPICFFYTDSPGDVPCVPPPQEHRCAIAEFGGVRKGTSACFNVDSLGCFGAKRYFGFSNARMPKFEYFLSCGIPGEVDGERYKKSPDIVLDWVSNVPEFTAPGPFIVFKRWDGLTEDDAPEAVIFFAKPDVLSGLFTLAGFEESDPLAVIAPFGAGCASIVQYPCLEQAKERPKAVLGTFDVSARPWVQRDVLTFAIPMKKFERMIGDMEESFLITPSWDRVRARMGSRQ
jgi:hypothetical protein